MDVAYIRWQRASSCVVLQILYETFSAHGIRTHPPQEDALSGWDQLHPPTALTKPVVEEEGGLRPKRPCLMVAAVWAPGGGE